MLSKIVLNSSTLYQLQSVTEAIIVIENISLTSNFFCLLDRLVRNVKFVRNLAPSHAQKDAPMTVHYHVIKVTI